MPAQQWAEHDDGVYMTAGKTVAELPAGMYDVMMHPQTGAVIFLTAVVREEEILRFPDAPIDEVVDELDRFWERADTFSRHGLPHKRGILLYGPPGSGKSSTLLLVARDVIARGGLVIMYNKAFLPAYRTLRQLQPDTPVVVLMEDLDEIMGPESNQSDQSRILNMLDGAERMHHVVFVATTNYPERLGERITNRPSRFDRRILVPHPTAANRRMYLETLLLEDDDVDIEELVKESDGFSLAHLKELVVGHVLLGNTLEATVRNLKGMADKAGSWQDGRANRLDRGAGGYA